MGLSDSSEALGARDGSMSDKEEYWSVTLSDACTIEVDIPLR